MEGGKGTQAFMNYEGNECLCLEQEKCAWKGLINNSEWKDSSKLKGSTLMPTWLYYCLWVMFAEEWFLEQFLNLIFPSLKYRVITFFEFLYSDPTSCFARENPGLQPFPIISSSWRLSYIKISKFGRSIIRLSWI